MKKKPRNPARPPAKYLGDRGREPEPVSEVLGTVFEKVAKVDRQTVELIEDWDEIAGPEWSAATPIGLRNGVLTVEVGSGAAASLLRFHVRALQEAITRRFGRDLVAAVRLKVRRGRRREPL